MQQIRERIAPEDRKLVLWTEEEDALLLHLRKTFGMDYGLIANRLPGRTRSAVGKRVLYMRERGRLDETTEDIPAPWEDHEDAALCAALANGMTYAAIAAKLGRSKNACIGRASRKGFSTNIRRHRAASLPEPVCTEPSRKVCAWPIGEPGEPDFHFCGGEPVTDRPYCDAHCRVAYTTYAEDEEINE